MRQKDHVPGLNPVTRLSEVTRGVLVCLILTVCLAIPAAANSKSAEEMEYEVKAAFIYNFMKFVQWPGAKGISDTDSPAQPIKIAVIGKHPYKKTLQLILDKTVLGRPVELVEMESLQKFRDSFTDRQSALDEYKSRYQASLAECHLVFICDSEKDCVADLLALTEAGAIVTVSDLPDFAAQRGMIGFVKDKKKVRFEVNLDAAQKENIKISSQLLGLATRVYKK